MIVVPGLGTRPRVGASAGGAKAYAVFAAGYKPPSCPVYEVPKVGSDFAVGKVIEVRLLNPDPGDEPVAYIKRGRHAREPLEAGDSVRQGDIISTGTNTVRGCPDRRGISNGGPLGLTVRR